jgi:hypothetical protein
VGWWAGWAIAPRTPALCCEGIFFARAHFFGAVTLDLHPPHGTISTRALAHSAAVRAGVWRVGGGWAVSHLEELMASSFLLLLWVAPSPRSVNVRVSIWPPCLGSHCLSLTKGRCLKTRSRTNLRERTFCLKVWPCLGRWYQYEDVRTSLALMTACALLDTNGGTVSTSRALHGKHLARQRHQDCYELVVLFASAVFSRPFFPRTTPRPVFRSLSQTGHGTALHLAKVKPLHIKRANAHHWYPCGMKSAIGIVQLQALPQGQALARAATVGAGGR